MTDTYLMTGAQSRMARSPLKWSRETLAKEANVCSLQDVLKNSFAYQDIIAHWHFANTLAAHELKHIEDNVLQFQQMEVCYV